MESTWSFPFGPLYLNTNLAYKKCGFQQPVHLSCFSLVFTVNNTQLHRLHNLMFILFWNARFSITGWLSRRPKCDRDFTSKCCGALRYFKQTLLLYNWGLMVLSWCLGVGPDTNLRDVYYLYIHIYNIVHKCVYTRACINLRGKFIKLYIQTHTCLSTYSCLPSPVSCWVHSQLNCYCCLV